MERPSRMEAASSPSYVRWPALRERLRRTWEQGQHATILGPTGDGKTHLALHGLLPLWSWVLVLDAKGEDRLLAKVKPRVRAYPQRPYPEGGATYRIAPAYDRAGKVFAEVMDRAWRDSTVKGGWVVYVDELRLFCDTRNHHLNRGGVLGERFERAWAQGRSRNMTLITSTQQPKHVPDTAFDQPRFIFIFQTSDREEVKRLREIGGSSEAIMEAVPHLGRYEFLLFDRRDRQHLVVSKLEGIR